MSSSSPMEVVIDNTESPDATRDTVPTNRSEHTSTRPHTDSSTPIAEPSSREPLDELFGLPYMQRADDDDLSDLCDKAAEEGLKGYDSDPAAAAVHLTLVKMLPSRPEELEVLFEELYPAVRDSEGGLQLLEKLDKGLEVKCSSSWEYMSGGRTKEAWMVTTDVDMVEEVASQLSAPGHKLNVAHESIRHHYDVRFHRLQWGFPERVPISFLVEDHIVVCFSVDLMALASFRMQRAGSDTCRTAFLDELVIDETRIRLGGVMAMPEDKMQRFKEARVRGMFVSDRLHWSVIIQGRDGKTAYLDTKEEHRTRRQASAQSWYRRYLNLSGVMPAGEEEVDWVDCDVPTQSDGWECGLVAVELWMRSVTGKSSPTRTVERWDLGQLVSELQSDISRELGQRIIDAAVWLDKSGFNHSDVLVRVCEAGKHPDGLETGVAEVVAEVEEVMGEDQANVDPQQYRRCCRLLVALAALDNEHCIRGELAEKAAQSDHWVGVEIDRIARGETYNFDDLKSFKVGGSAA